MLAFRKRRMDPRRARCRPDFDPNFEIPRWGWWIVLYFFLGGITGGVYFAAAWLDLFGDANDRAAMRLGHLIAFPLIVVSGLVLVVDLGQPLRFWHMIFQSERFPAADPQAVLADVAGLGDPGVVRRRVVHVVRRRDRRPRALAAFAWQRDRQSVVGARRAGRAGPGGLHRRAAERDQRAGVGQQSVDRRAVLVLGRLDGIALLLLLARRVPRRRSKSCPKPTTT